MMNYVTIDPFNTLHGWTLNENLINVILEFNQSNNISINLGLLVNRRYKPINHPG